MGSFHSGCGRHRLSFNRPPSVSELARPLVDDQHQIPDEALLYRRIDWDMVGGRLKCPVGETPMLSGNCFSDRNAEWALKRGLAGACMSVGVGTVLRAKGHLPSVVLGGKLKYGLAVIRAGDLRNLKRKSGALCPQGVMLYPTEDEPWHGVVFDMSGRRSDAARSAIASAATWEIALIRHPDDDDPIPLDS